MPAIVRPFFFGAVLVTPEKKLGGVRPIAVGCTLRRLVAKIAGKIVVGAVAELLSPRQLGYRVCGGVEAAVHATRKYLQNLPSEHAMLKLDFTNAFNSVHRDKVLEAVQDLAPNVYPLAHSSYSTSSSLLWGDKVIQSKEGVQQAGSIPFFLAIHRHCEQLRSPLCVMYLDDVSVGGSMDDVLHDLDVIKAGENLGLFLNCSKCEVICHDVTVRAHIASALPGAMVVNPKSACLLGSPLGDVASIDASSEEKIRALSIMASRFPHLSAHDSLTLLCHSFAIPKLHYLLRTTPCFLSDLLEKYDSTLHSILNFVTNTPLLQNDKAWMQATLPVMFGGLVVSRAVQLAPSAYLSSSAATADLVSAILPTTHQSLPVPSIDAALQRWSEGHSESPPIGAGAVREKYWEEIRTANAAKPCWMRLQMKWSGRDFWQR